MEWIVFAVFGLFVVAGMVLGNIQAKKRRLALAAWAQAHQLAFREGEDGSLEDRYPAFDALRRGENRYGYNLMTGAWKSRPFLGFDYHYETHSTDSKGRRHTHHHHFSAVLIESRAPFKPLHIDAENFFDRIADALGFDDIDFESAEFSRKFRVKSPDRKWAYAVLHPRAMELLLSRPVYTLALTQHGALAHRGARFAPEQFAEAADLLCDLLDLMPEYLLRELQEAASTPPPLPP